MSAKPVFVAIIGAGTVGSAFIPQLQHIINTTTTRSIVPLLIARSSKCLVSRDYTGLNLSNWAADLEASNITPPSFPTETLKWLKSAPGEVVLVDNTSSLDIASQYPAFLSAGIHIVTPNKKGVSDTLPLWDAIFSASRNGGNATGGYFYHEASCGAGLPIIGTINDLVKTGDKIKKVEGVFSGTMSFLFNTFHPASGTCDEKFSSIVEKAKEAGYTEPDPRDDLNGLDVARKLTILARLSGLKVSSPTSFPIESLVPTELESVASAAEFLSGLPKFDNVIEERKNAAEKEGKVLRYVGKLDVEKNQVSVGIEAFERGTAIASLRGSDNVISFFTERYGANPLVVQGAGAGAEVTAMGITADLLRVLERLN